MAIFIFTEFSVCVALTIMKVLITVTAILFGAAAAVNKELPDESSGNRMHYTTGDRYSERHSTVKK
jgi:hypothetical protein